MPDEALKPVPLVERTTESKETVTSAVAPLATLAAADDNIRKGLAVLVVLQFVLLVGYMLYHAGGAGMTNVETMVLGAEISFMTSVLSYFFGSSSGSTSKSIAAGNKL